MDNAHIYFFTNQARNRWRVRICFPAPRTTYRPPTGTMDRTGFKSFKDAKVWAFTHSGPYRNDYLGTKSVPDPAAER